MIPHIEKHWWLYELFYRLKFLMSLLTSQSKFGSRSGDLKRKSTLPMVMPPPEDIVERWHFYEA